MSTLSAIGLGVGVGMGLLTAWVADRKHRSPAWGVAGVLFWPVALPWVLLLKPESPRTETEFDPMPFVYAMLAFVAVCLLVDAWLLL